MYKIAKVAFLCFAIILFAGNLGQISAAKPKPLAGKRVGLYRSWLAAVSDVAIKSQDPKALELYKFICDHGLLAEPVYDSTLSIRFLEGAKSGDTKWVAIVPTMATDHDSGQAWKKITAFPSQELGHYEPDYRTIVLNFHDSLSVTLRGLVMLKETYHAEKFISRYGFKKPPLPNLTERIEEEKKGFNFISGLTKILGGTAYEQMIKKEVKRIQGKIVSNFLRSGKFNYEDTPPVIYDTELEKIFGQAKSEMDLINRRNVLWMSAFFQVIDSDTTIARKEETKNAFVRSLLGI